VALLAIMPLTFLPTFPTPLFPVWILMIHKLLTVPFPSFLLIWIESLALDLLHDLPIGVTFLSFSVLCGGIELWRKPLLKVPFWGWCFLAPAIALCEGALFFRGQVWNALPPVPSWGALAATFLLYPIISWKKRE
jgi:hypothetical protein